ncbi:Glucan endo-1,3-beta-glucosidase, putative [Penicillium digitatum]|uniref:Glucan endo-1,3-beta-glucosidase, putative n=3 Tax=Penicillium digitatum TaxID=36651 RepID=K9FLP5_PEND2|nr:Glucan endo-1,3-beta-glucosidase, putative [Penicillium digitatum Pd1]EKV07653.1 Glucan endo-1,3-beta-glucosidase, putative [Penicillium digitatum Pd1]EKV09207.1 Glucan endo-1,3-beta-glucosidase, putative [Penicillium digitatum PHI26]QQK41311.1 Glucan endo-1,3-beta-glucosidase, putative [Penicillium digitatum]
MATLNFALKNNTGSNTVYAYITGQALDHNNALFLLRSDGKTAYYPTSPSATGTSLSEDCAIPLGASGSTTTITIPHLAGARLWFARDNRLTFFLNPGPALVEPSVSNPSDRNYNLVWAFCEFTWNHYQLYANLSYVDFVSMPIAMTLTNGSGATQTVRGLPPNGLDLVCNALREQNNKDGAGWDKLIIQRNGVNLRALSPNTGRALNQSLFRGYYEGYVNQVWSYYENSTRNTLTVNTQANAGDVTAKVTSGLLSFSIPGITYTKPSTGDIFSNSSGSFAVSGNGTKDAITARLAAAFNRSTLLINGNQPNGETVSNYYKNPVTNHYSRICHSVSIDSRGYAFPYDDVAPKDGSDQSGSVFDGNPKLLTVTIGGGPSNSAKQSAIENAAAPVRQPVENGKKSSRFHELRSFVDKLSHRQSNT